MGRLKLVLFALSIYTCPIQATMVMDKGDWQDLGNDAQMGYVIAFIDSYFYVALQDEAENEKRGNIRNCIEGMDTNDFIRIVDMQLEDIGNYKKPAWFLLKQGLEQICS